MLATDTPRPPPCNRMKANDDLFTVLFHLRDRSSSDPTPPCPRAFKIGTVCDGLSTATPDRYANCLPCFLSRGPRSRTRPGERSLFSTTLEISARPRFHCDASPVDDPHANSKGWVPQSPESDASVQHAAQYVAPVNRVRLYIRRDPQYIGSARRNSAIELVKKRKRLFRTTGRDCGQFQRGNRQ